MRKVVKDNLSKQMSTAQFEVMLGLWNVDELGQMNQWVTDDRLNLEAADNDQKLLQLRVLIDNQNGVDNYMYGITISKWREYLEDFLGITPAIALKFQAELHKITQQAIDAMWKARNAAKHGMTTPYELWELRTFEEAIQSWKTDTERKGKVMVEGSEVRIRAFSRKKKLKWMHNRLTNQNSITDYWNKTPALHVEEGLGLGLGGELGSVELELGRDGHQPPDIPLKVQIRVERRLERKQRQQPQQRQLTQYFQPKGKGKRGSASISNTSTASVEPNQQLSKKQARGENSRSGTEVLDRQIADDHHQIGGMQIRTRVLQLQVKRHDTLQGTPICLKRKALNNLDPIQSDGKKQSVEKTQPKAIIAISETDRKRIESNRLTALRIQQERVKKRKECEGKSVIDRPEKRKQWGVNYKPEIKKQRWSLEINVVAQAGLSKRQKKNGQTGCAQLVCSTHKGIS